MKYGLSDKTIAAIQAVLAENLNIESAVLYGSRAKGTYREGSDIDLALIGEGSEVKLTRLYYKIS